jgi:hypothetical protein
MGCRRVLVCLLWLALVCVTSSGQSRRKAGSPAARVRAEQATVEALVRARIPVQKDESGRVRWIEAPRGEVTDTGLALIARLGALEWLEIAGARITGQGLAQLKACTNLKRLYIHDVTLGGQDPTWLSALTHLESLSLQRTGISGRVLQDLQSAPLRNLNLSGTRIGDEDIAEVVRMKNLEVLALEDTRITGAGLAKLAGMQKLNVLNIGNCKIGDADVKHFLSMPNLRIVHAAGCRISDTAVESMKDQLPMLSIFR